MILSFGDLSEMHISQLWNDGSNEEGWPQAFMTITELQQYMQMGNFPNNFVHGEVKGIWLCMALAGFMTLHEIEPGFTDQDRNVFEGGTYLLPRFRGIGLNDSIKRRIVNTVFNTYNASWCIFCIPETNLRAIRAMDKLLLPFERVTIQDSHHFLHRYLKWKSWKAGTGFILYALSRYQYT